MINCQVTNPQRADTEGNYMAVAETSRMLRVATALGLSPSDLLVEIDWRN